MIHLILPIEPAAKQTKGNRVVTTPDGRTFVARYTPADVKRNEKEMIALLTRYRPEEPLDGPLSVTIEVTKYWLAGDSQRVRKAGVPIPNKSKPDCDNLAKQVLDVLQRAGFIVNDSRVAELIVRTMRGPCGPCTEIKILTWDERVNNGKAEAERPIGEVIDAEYACDDASPANPGGSPDSDALRGDMPEAARSVQGSQAGSV